MNRATKDFENRAQPFPFVLQTRCRWRRLVLLTSGHGPTADLVPSSEGDCTPFNPVASAFVQLLRADARLGAVRERSRRMMRMGAAMPRDCAATNDATTAVRRLVFGWRNSHLRDVNMADPPQR